MLNNGQFKNDATKPAAPLDVDFIPLPGEAGSGPKPLGTVLPPKTAQEAAADKAKRASRTFPVGTKLTFPKGQGTTTRLRAGVGPVADVQSDTDKEIPGFPGVKKGEIKYKVNPTRVADADAKLEGSDDEVINIGGNKLTRGEYRKQIAEAPANPRHPNASPRHVIQKILGGTSLKDAPSGVPGIGKFGQMRLEVGRTRPEEAKPEIDQEVYDKTGLEVPSGKTKSLAQVVQEQRKQAETTPEVEPGKPAKVKAEFSTKELSKAAEEMAFSHWSSRQPQADFTAHDKRMAKHKAKVDSWAKGNPMPEDDSHLGEGSQRVAWRAKRDEWRARNPEPENERMKVRDIQTKAFKALPAGQKPMEYLKGVRGVTNLTAVKEHLKQHLRNQRAEVAAVTRDEPKPARTYTPETVEEMWRSKPEVSPERSTGIETFAKNPLSFHFGTGSGEGKK